jgi:DNA polymerase IV
VYKTPNGGRHRRVDLICALPETYWTAIVGWTGATMFQRDLRSAAKAVFVRHFFCYVILANRFVGRGLKFDSSAMYVQIFASSRDTHIVIFSTRRRDSHLIFPRSEKEVFDVIGLPWVDPTLRNTDA